MLLGILSDTHDHIEHIEKAKKLFAAKGASPLIHLGDFCSGPAVRAFKGTKLIGILGNNDGDPLSLQRNFGLIEGDFRGQFCVLEYDGKKIACYHGTVAELAEALILCGKYDVVLYGHSHQPSIKQHGKTLAINPGTVHGVESTPTVVILDTKTLKAEILSLE